jgi:digeranylgeranylglycerophospholipid reductase
MPQALQTDVVLVGAGTSGCYLAWRLAQAGLGALILEKRRLEDLGQHLDIFHMDAVRLKEFGIPVPTEEEGELIGYYPAGLAWSPDLQVSNEVRYAFYVMHKPAFQRRMYRYVREAGGEILDQVEVTEPIVEDGFVVGVRAVRDNEPFVVSGRIVVDASGINSVVRTRLPADFCAKNGIENDPIRDKDTLFVCLEFRDGLGEGYPTGLNFYPFHKAFWNPSRGDGVILGIGQPGSYEYAWRKHQEWREEYFGDPGQVLKRLQGKTPYRRSPYSLVGNGFMVVGDAAFQTKPFSGEGVTSSFTACQVAAEVATEAVRRGDVSRESLWDYNVRYFRNQGAKFASMFVQLPAAAELSRREVDYLFHHDIIFSGKDFEQMNLNYETEMGLGKTVLMGFKLVRGVLSGQLSLASLKRLLGVSSTAAKIKALYQRFPEDPSQLPAWVADAKSLWGET